MVGTTHGAMSTRPLGPALRAAREAMTPKVGVRELARRLDMDHTRLSRIETGQLVPDRDTVAKIGAATGMTESEIGQLLAEANRVEGDRWIATKYADRKMQMQALLAFERIASAITVVRPMMIPGLLQIPDYTRAIMQVGSMPEWDIVERVEVRSSRSQILVRRHNPTPYTALIGEEALRRTIGSPAVMHDQLMELWAWSDPDRPHIDIRIIPASAGYYPGIGAGGFMLLDFASRPSLVQLDTIATSLFLYEEKDLRAHREAVDIVRSLAMGRAESRDLIASIAHLHETGSESVA